jgi:cell pole-organizing protein PopZ
MAQAGSAQREPSMEEILASIRRIIEDNDTGRKPELSVAPAADPVDFEVERVANAVVEVDAFRSELQASPVRTEPQAAPPARSEAKPMSLAEVQAQVAEEDAHDDEYPTLKAGNDAGPIPVVTLRSEQPQPAGVEEEPTFEIVPATSHVEPAAEEPVRAEATPTPRPAIISEHASRQVAAAFGELSDAFAARSKKTFDEMAEEMLRPMLQDWLDNNLPTLVERLVREEIERVARNSRAGNRVTSSELIAAAAELDAVAGDVWRWRSGDPVAGADGSGRDHPRLTGLMALLLHCAGPSPRYLMLDNTAAFAAVDLPLAFRFTPERPFPDSSD